MSKPKAPKEDPSTIALRKQQVADSSALDEEENRRVKQLLVGQRGGRFFRGSPMTRAAPGNRAGAGPASGSAAGSSGSGSAVFSASAAIARGLAGMNPGGRSSR